jgi:hypothetical protein
MIKIINESSQGLTLYHSVPYENVYNFVKQNGIVADSSGWVYLTEKPYYRNKNWAYATFKVFIPNNDNRLHDWDDFWLDEDGNEIDFDHEKDPNNHYYMYEGNIPLEYIIDEYIN